MLLSRRSLQPKARLSKPGKQNTRRWQSRGPRKTRRSWSLKAEWRRSAAVVMHPHIGADSGRDAGVLLVLISRVVSTVGDRYPATTLSSTARIRQVEAT